MQAPGYVVIRYEMIHEARIIPIGTSARLPASMRGYMGDARGRWEGETLVVETTNIRDEIAYRGSNGARLKLTERFTPIAKDKVRWSVTVDDPSTWVRPWTFAMPLTLDNSEPLFNYECHEGNYAMSNILSAARAEERAAAEDAKKGIVRPRSNTAAETEQER